MAQKPVVFISHVHEDGELANKIADQIRSDFLNAVDVFVGSDGNSIRGGDRWMETIESNLRNAKIVIILITSKSVGRKWVYFEAGGAFFGGARVIPLLDGSISINKLGPPLNYLQCCLLNDTIHLSHIYSLIAECATMNTPSINFNELAGKLAQKDGVANESNDIHLDAKEKSEILVPSAGPTKNIRDIAKSVIKQAFAREISNMMATTGKERDHSEELVNHMLQGILPDDPPQVIAEWWRGMCISEGELYFFQDLVGMVPEFMKERSEEEQVQIMEWMGRILLGD
ncbi:MAG: toll/interleukin-1 receptor domain-containing protein [Desulfarculus sp.]|nr:toll/interleukin-1 receptor domain-containing protein [Desulfarculus sp.]